jgi:hypothetical protein
LEAGDIDFVLNIRDDDTVSTASHHLYGLPPQSTSLGEKIGRLQVVEGHDHWWPVLVSGNKMDRRVHLVSGSLELDIEHVEVLSLRDLSYLLPAAPTPSADVSMHRDWRLEIGDFVVSAQSNDWRFSCDGVDVVAQSRQAFADLAGKVAHAALVGRIFTAD